MSELSFPIPDELLEAIAERVAELLAERAPAASPYLSVAEAAELLRADRQRVYDLLSARRLTRHKDGRRVLVSRAELDAHLLPPEAGTTAREAGPGGADEGTIRRSRRAPNLS